MYAIAFCILELLEDLESFFRRGCACDLGAVEVLGEDEFLLCDGLVVADGAAPQLRCNISNCRRTFSACDGLRDSEGLEAGVGCCQRGGR